MFQKSRLFCFVQIVNTIFDLQTTASCHWCRSGRSRPRRLPRTHWPAALVYGGGERAKRSAAVVYSGQCCKHRCKHRDIVGLAPAQVQQK